MILSSIVYVENAHPNKDVKTTRGGAGSARKSSDKSNNDENGDDRDLSIIEEFLFTKLQEQGFTTEDRGLDKTGRVEGGLCRPEQKDHSALDPRPSPLRARRPPPRHWRASPDTQLNQEDRLHTGQGIADKHGLVDSTFDTFPINEGQTEQQQAVEQEGRYNSGDKDRGLQILFRASWFKGVLSDTSVSSGSIRSISTSSKNYALL
ncbi:hypothetical protein BKA61DRAFT_575240 [Leptodontidium sp. MPI-SDFR-AT-0119]|nr:hypothetical protein BKA61DRAFT_575240 [Leptodontidium sp. MPI-SDFR-AT-0119]